MVTFSTCEGAKSCPVFCGGVLEIFKIPQQLREITKLCDTYRELVKTLFFAAETANRANALSCPCVDLIAHVGCRRSVVCHLLHVYSQSVGASSTKPNDLAALVRPRRSVKQP